MCCPCKNKHAPRHERAKTAKPQSDHVEMIPVTFYGGQIGGRREWDVNEDRSEQDEYKGSRRGRRLGGWRNSVGGRERREEEREERAVRYEHN